jgi:hypothetical protein
MDLVISDPKIKTPGFIGEWAIPCKITVPTGKMMIH